MKKDSASKENRDKKRYRRAYSKLPLRDQNGVTDCLMDVARKTKLRHEDIFYLLGKVGEHLARKNGNCSL